MSELSELREELEHLAEQVAALNQVAKEHSQVLLLLVGTLCDLALGEKFDGAKLAALRESLSKVRR